MDSISSRIVAMVAPRVRDSESPSKRRESRFVQLKEDDDDEDQNHAPIDAMSQAQPIVKAEQRKSENRALVNVEPGDGHMKAQPNFDVLVNKPAKAAKSQLFLVVRVV